MSEEQSKSNPIPTRYDDETSAVLDRIHEATGVPKAEIIRRAVKYALNHAKTKRSLDFLLGDSSLIDDIFGPENEGIYHQNADKSDPTILVREADESEK